MIWQPLWSRQARSDLARLDRVMRDRISAAVRRFAETGQGNVILLRGQSEDYRVRVGDWRVRIQFDHEGKIMHVIRVLHRREAYR